jgi:hypothetical protein
VNDDAAAVAALYRTLTDPRHTAAARRRAARALAVHLNAGAPEPDGFDRDLFEDTYNGAFL